MRTSTQRLARLGSNGGDRTATRRPIRVQAGSPSRINASTRELIRQSPWHEFALIRFTAAGEAEAARALRGVCQAVLAIAVLLFVVAVAQADRILDVRVEMQLDVYGSVENGSSSGVYQSFAGIEYLSAGAIDEQRCCWWQECQFGCVTNPCQNGMCCQWFEGPEVGGHVVANWLATNGDGSGGHGASFAMDYTYSGSSSPCSDNGPWGGRVVVILVVEVTSALANVWRDVNPLWASPVVEFE